MTASLALGVIGAVNGATVSVRLAQGSASGIAIIGGRSYRVGQVGSFVRIPQGYHDLYGIISDVGATATPLALTDVHDRGERWMTVQLVGETVQSSFERGIGQYPNINDEVHLVTEEDLAKVYGADGADSVTIGYLSNAESIPVRIDLEKLVTRHSAVLGSTGSGKSTTISSLLRSIAGAGASSFPSARILVLDIHGEYAQGLADVASVFRVTPTNKEEKALHIPFWALPLGTLLPFLMGKLDDRAFTAIGDRIMSAKSSFAEAEKPRGIDPSSLTVDTPLPFSLQKIWFDLIDPEIRTYSDKDRTVRAIEKEGDPATLSAPSYKPYSTNNTAPFQNTTGTLGIRRQLDQMRSRLLDHQFEFLLSPGDWSPNLAGKSKKDLPDLLEAWIGDKQPITVLDLSGIPSDVLVQLVGGILSILFDALFWGRELPEGGRQRPLLVVMEEAHRYLGKESSNPARQMVQRIVKEGRKFGVGAMIVSQRPSEIDDTILSQCGTFVALRMTNNSDRAHVQGALPDNLSGIADTLSILRTGEAIVTGEAAKLPVRCRITLPPQDHRPNSDDPHVARQWHKPRIKEDYPSLVAAWRAQNPRFRE
jgi:DNA helicase HerA-like ATPase